MEMTIDNAIEHIKQARFDYCEFWEETKNDTTIAYDLAIDIMRKHQQIQKIIEYPDIQEDVLKFKAICEVVKDGNDS